MTRFNISIEEGVNLVFFALNNAFGGELYVPKIASYNIMDLASAVDSECKKEIIGIRPGEKLHEEMISESDSPNTYDIGDKYVILPNNFEFLKQFILKFQAEKVPLDFSYNSKDNKSYLSINDLREKISKIKF